MKKHKKRQDLMKNHNHKYTRHYTNEGYYCFYCGDPAEGLDHVPPLDLMDNMPYEQRKRAKIPSVTLACCSECNSALSSRKLVTVDERLDFLESFYDAKFKKQSAMWSQEEINELGPSLQASVRARQEKLQRFIHKIRGIQRRARLIETHPTWEPTDEEEKASKKAHEGV